MQWSAGRMSRAAARGEAARKRAGQPALTNKHVAGAHDVVKLLPGIHAHHRPSFFKQEPEGALLGDGAKAVVGGRTYAL